MKRLNGKQLAKLLGVATPTLTSAVKKDYLCNGQPVANWADVNERGRVQGYNIPDEVYNKFVPKIEENTSDELTEEEKYEEWLKITKDNQNKIDRILRKILEDAGMDYDKV